MAKKKTHEFVTIADIIDNITLANKDNFLVDFKGWLEVVLNTSQSIKLSIELGATPEQKEQFKDMPVSELIGCKSIKWIDDGKHNMSMKVTIKP